jgi:spore maturation protein SpmA/spore maturation protein SpmB
MLNYIWLGLIGLAVLIGGFRGNMLEVGDGAVAGAKTAVELAFGLIGVMTLWLGLMRLADKAGLVRRLGLVLKPILVWLFPEVPANHPAMGAIVLNVAANILGLNNAATPLGLRAMNELETLNKRPGIATNAMCMLLAINTSSITLIPVTVIGVLALYHGKNPTVIIGTSLAATAIAHVFAIGSCKLLERTRWSRRQLEEKVTSPQTIEAHQAAVEGGDIEDKAEKADATLPWVPGAKWVLAGLAGIFIAMVVAYAASPHEAAHVLPIRLIDALSMLVLPWLILLFPLYAAMRRIPVYDEFVEGGKEGFHVILRILPYIVAMLVAIGMFRAAGGMEMITDALSPVTNLLHFPSELVPIALIRPFSGTAALALLTDMVKDPAYGPDNIVTLMAATFYGCSETTFYVIAVYFGSVGIRRTRHAIPAGLIADMVGPIASVVICRAVLG